MWRARARCPYDGVNGGPWDAIGDQPPFYYLHASIPRARTLFGKFLSHWRLIGDEGDARNAALASPSGVSADSAGNVYIADSDNHCIRKLDARGIITTYAGSGASGFAGDGAPACLAKLSFPRSGPAIGGGSLYVIDAGNARIRVINANGVIRAVAGNGMSGFSPMG